jgi:hypothetical protein
MELPTVKSLKLHGCAGSGLALMAKANLHTHSLRVRIEPIFSFFPSKLKFVELEQQIALVT